MIASSRPAQLHQPVWRLALPLILSNLSVALLGIVDTAVVGHLDQVWYLGAVAIGAVVFDFLYWGMGFLRMGTTALTARASGQGKSGALVLNQGLMLALLIGVLAILLQLPLVELVLLVLEGSEQVSHYAREYICIRLWGAPAALSCMVLSGWMLGHGHARATLLIAVSMNLVNVVLDLILVALLDFGVAGVAWASVVAEYCGLATGLWLLQRHVSLPQVLASRHGLKWQELRLFFGINQSIFIRTLCLILVFTWFTRTGASQGDGILAANAVLMNFQALLALGLDGFANALESLVGRCLGRQDASRLRAIIKSATNWSVGLAAVYTLCYWLLGMQLIQLMTDLPVVIQLAADYLPWLILSPFISVWCFLLDGIFLGALRAGEMRNAMLFNTFAVFFPLWFVSQQWDNHGLWLSFIVFQASRAISLAYCLYRRPLNATRDCRQGA